MAPIRRVAVGSRMRRSLPAFLALLGTTLGLTAAEPALAGRIENRTYIASGGLFRVPIPVLPELGGTVTDTANVVNRALIEACGKPRPTLDDIFGPKR